MTQIIGLISEDCVLLASDRMVTFQNIDGEARFRDDATCKLVNFANIAGIAHAGLAEIGGLPTNEWIAKILAENDCQAVFQVVQVLRLRATELLRDENKKLRSVEIIVAGWAAFGTSSELRPHFFKISNCYDDKGSVLLVPKDEFDIRVKVLKKGQRFMFTDGGVELPEVRKIRFNNEVNEVLDAGGSSKEILMTMIREIMLTSINQEVKTVGSSILSMCLPRFSVNVSDPTGKVLFLAKEPSKLEGSFYFFENGYSELVQYGPTFVNNGVALTDFTSENSPDQQSQSSQVRILYHTPGRRFGLVVRHSSGQ